MKPTSGCCCTRREGLTPLLLVGPFVGFAGNSSRIKSGPETWIFPQSMFLTGTASRMFGLLSARPPVRVCLTGGKPAETKPCKKDRSRVPSGVRVVPPQGRGGQRPPPGAYVGDTLEPVLKGTPHRLPRMAQTWLFMRQVVALGIEAGFRITTVC